eukprot:m.94499 g.94499  ORF g.94499 m.94499 type:complete len:673 (-) comp51251_c0_seq2:40-2058(-)
MGREAELLKAAADGDIHKIREICGQQKKSRSLVARITTKKKKAAEDEPQEEAEVQERDGVIAVEKVTHVNMEARDHTGATALILAALTGHRAATQLLISCGSNVLAKDSNQNTALHFAAWQEREHSIDILQILLKNGAKPNDCNVDGDTALHNASHHGKAYAVLLLIDAGFDPRIQNKDSETALDVAVRFDSREVVPVLLDHDRALLDSGSALRIAARHGRTEISRMLLDAGASCTSQESESGDTPLHIAARNTRVGVCEQLLAFGADANLQNGKSETPVSIVNAQPISPDRNRILRAIREFADKEALVPAVVLDKRRQRTEEAKRDTRLLPEASSIYPLLKARSRWTQDSAQYRSSAEPNRDVTNLLSENVTASWCATGASREWVVFDFGNPYTINGIVIVGWQDKSMPKDVQLEVADTLNGPWRVIKSFKAEMVCQPDHLDPETKTFQQGFAEFHATSQYWRVHVLRNYGAPQTIFQGVRFYGIDALLQKWFIDHQLEEYYTKFVQAGFNQVKDLVYVTEADLKHLIELPGHRKKISLSIQQLRGEVAQFDRLVFSVAPPRTGMADKTVSFFEVQAGPRIAEEVRLVVRGARVRGTFIRRLTPNGELPSVAFFDDIVITPAGSYVIEVQSVQLPEKVFIASDYETVIEPNDGTPSAIDVLFGDLEHLLDF